MEFLLQLLLLQIGLKGNFWDLEPLGRLVVCYTLSFTFPYSLQSLLQVFICHDLDTGRELAVKVIGIDHIDHATPSSDSMHMQRVSNMSGSESNRHRSHRPCYPIIRFYAHAKSKSDAKSI